MKYLFVFFPILLISLFSTTNTKAQINEPCLPDCENSDWIPSYPNLALEIGIPLCNTTVFVRYRYRVACNTWYDYYIETIGSMNDEIRDCINNTYGNLNNFMQAVTEQLIILNPAGFPPQNNGECETNWRVMKGSCWTLIYFADVPLGPPPETISYNYSEMLIPCTTNDCCLEYFTVCLDQNGNRTITQTGYLPPEDPDCEGEPQYGPWGCQPVCGSIYNR